MWEFSTSGELVCPLPPTLRIRRRALRFLKAFWQVNTVLSVLARGHDICAGPRPGHLKVVHGPSSSSLRLQAEREMTTEPVLPAQGSLGTHLLVCSPSCRTLLFRWWLHWVGGVGSTLCMDLKVTGLFLSW